MENIVIIKGEVKYTITLDPGVWIFDDRKVDLQTYFSNEKEVNNFENEMKQIAGQWDQEFQEEASSPPVQESVTKFEKEKVIKGTFGIPLRPFLVNANPNEKATTLIIETSDSKTHEISLNEGFDAILGFSKDGKPLKENGPIHFYFGDGSNIEEPITNVTGFIVK